MKSGENRIHLSTSKSELIFILIYQPIEQSLFKIRLGSLSFPHENNIDLERVVHQFFFLTQLVRCTFDEIFYKQFGSIRSILFHIEKEFHHINMSKDDFQDQQNSEEIFKIIYRRMMRTDFAPGGSVKLILHSNIAPTLTFAYSKWKRSIQIQRQISSSFQRFDCIQFT